MRWKMIKSTINGFSTFALTSFTSWVHFRSHSNCQQSIRSQSDNSFNYRLRHRLLSVFFFHGSSVLFSSSSVYEWVDTSWMTKNQQIFKQQTALAQLPKAITWQVGSYRIFWVYPSSYCPPTEAGCSRSEADRGHEDTLNEEKDFKKGAMKTRMQGVVVVDIVVVVRLLSN